jgi:hypothetical protein
MREDRRLVSQSQENISEQESSESSDSEDHGSNEDVNERLKKLYCNSGNRSQSIFIEVGQSTDHANHETERPADPRDGICDRLASGSKLTCEADDELDYETSEE